MLNLDFLTKYKFHLLIGALLIQSGILAGEFLNSIYPHWIGQEVRFYVEPVDPRSLMRGNFARLEYEINHLSSDLLKEEYEDELRPGQILYVRLRKTADVYRPLDIKLTKPESGIFIRGRLRDSYGSTLYIDYGIEAYFAKKEIALDIEERVRKIRINGERKKMYQAITNIAPNGKAALVELFFPLK